MLEKEEIITEKRDKNLHFCEGCKKKQKTIEKGRDALKYFKKEYREVLLDLSNYADKQIHPHDLKELLKPFKEEFEVFKEDFLNNKELRGDLLESYEKLLFLLYKVAEERGFPVIQFKTSKLKNLFLENY